MTIRLLWLGVSAMFAVAGVWRSLASPHPVSNVALWLFAVSLFVAARWCVYHGADPYAALIVAFWSGVFVEKWVARTRLKLG